jgi:hypothetical protein
MAENKTKANEASVEAYLQSIEGPSRREDCLALSRLMEEATHYSPKMWGASIVGFGSYHYKYASGREGDACLTGFSSRKTDITVYLVKDFPGQAALLEKLGKFKMGKGCIYLRRLADVDLEILAQLVAGAVAERRRVYG